MEDDDFHGRMSRSSREGIGLRICDPNMSPAERSQLLSNWKDDFHRGITERRKLPCGSQRDLPRSPSLVDFLRRSTEAPVDRNDRVVLFSNEKESNGINEDIEEASYGNTRSSIPRSIEITEHKEESLVYRSESQEKAKFWRVSSGKEDERRKLETTNSLDIATRIGCDNSNESVLPKKPPNCMGVALAAPSLIFPVSHIHTGSTTADSFSGSNIEGTNVKLRKITLALDQCTSSCIPGRKKLFLKTMNLTADDIPLDMLLGSSLGLSLRKLSLSGNPLLGSIPKMMVQFLPCLKTLDLSQCNLRTLPSCWNLPKLARLNLRHNCLTEFPAETILEGLPALQELNIYGNRITEIVLPRNTKSLSNLVNLDLGYNDLIQLPEGLEDLCSLRTLRLANNMLATVPMRVCEIKSLKELDVTSNPITQPPLECCEAGISAMKRYWQDSTNESKDFTLRKVRKLPRNSVLNCFKSSPPALEEKLPATAYSTDLD